MYSSEKAWSLAVDTGREVVMISESTQHANRTSIAMNLECYVLTASVLDISAYAPLFLSFGVNK